MLITSILHSCCQNWVKINSNMCLACFLRALLSKPCAEWAWESSQTHEQISSLQNHAPVKTGCVFLLGPFAFFQNRSLTLLKLLKLFFSRIWVFLFFPPFNASLLLILISSIAVNESICKHLKHSNHLKRNARRKFTT